MRRSGLFIVLCSCLLSGLSAAAPSSIPLANPGFEEGETGQAPPGWTVQPGATQAGYTVREVEETPESGRRCLEVALPGVRSDFNVFTNVQQTLDAAPLRGKRVRFSAAARFAGKDPLDSAGLWVRVDRAGGKPGFYDERSVTAAQWTRYQITGDVATDAESIKVGFSLPFSGRACFDSAAFDVLGEAGLGNEPARPLTARGLDNLVAFTRLFGDVRYFHPSDQAAAADWESLALAGVQKAETAADAAALARTLEDFFRPVAPTVRVFPTGHQPPLPTALAKPAGDVHTVAWRHIGLGQGEATVYKSSRVDSRAPTAGAPVRVEQDVDAAPFRGKTVRLRAAVRAELPAGHHASLWLTVRRPKSETGFKDDGSHPFGSGPWHTEEITGEVAPDAVTLAFGLALDRQGKAWIDDARLEIVGAPGQGDDPHSVENPSFEEGEAGWAPDGWEIDRQIRAAGYSFTRSGEQPHSGAWSGLLAGGEAPGVPIAPGEPFVADLGGGVSALVPLALWADAAGTLPHGDPGAAPPKPGKPEGFFASGNDRATRLADVAIAWNIFQHFYPYFDVAALEGTTDWLAVLRASLREAADDPDDDAFKRTLRRLVAALHDGHGAVSHGSADSFFTPPLAWDWIEGRLVVAWSDPEQAAGIRPGDAIVSIDGKPAREALEAAEALVSGATPQYRRFRALSPLAGGVKGEEMRLAIEPLDGPPRTVTLRRTLPYYGEGSARTRRLQALPPKIAELKPGIFYVDLARISDDDFQGALDRLAAAKGVVFDLRVYPSQISLVVLQHLTGRSIRSAQWHVPLVTRPDRQDVIWLRSRWTLAPLPPRLSGKIAFLTGAGAISYAETYMGIVEAYKLAAIVGGPTAGTNGNINPFDLPGGYHINWSGMKTLKHDGTRHHGIGIHPTVPVAPTRRGLAAGKDEVLEKGLEVVGG